MTEDKTFQMRPIGYVRRAGEAIHLEILEPYRPGLKQLEHFSHVMVFWWVDEQDNDKSRAMLQSEPPYAQGKLTGVFAMRSEYRPNPIGMTTCQLLDCDEKTGIVRLANIDAFENTAIVDLKAYFPVCDRVENAHIPDWLAGWPDSLPEQGMGLWGAEDTRHS